jgi:two-component system, OmpR family, phosphate regulon response regulator PhoB
VPNRATHIAVVEDDHEVRSLLRDVLEDDGFEVTAVSDGEKLLGLLGHRRPDLVVLDLGLPGIGGLDLLRRIGNAGRIPTIVVSGRGAETDRVVGLELGADDYLAKPFSHRELLARVHAVLRRSAVAPAAERLEFQGLVIDLATRDVMVGGRTVGLTAREFELLAFLASSPRQVFSKEVLLDRVWGSSTEWQDTATVSEHVHRLRRKLTDDHGEAGWIETRRGAGYRFVPDPGYQG